MLSITQEAFETYNKQSKTFIVQTQILSDYFTPVGVYQQVRGDSKYSYLLESVNQNENIGRFSIIGFDPLVRFSIFDDHVLIDGQICSKDDDKKIKPFEHIEQLIKEHTPINLDQFDDFLGGFVGYLGYDTIRHFENIKLNNPDDLNIPESLLFIPTKMIVFDHLYQVINIYFICRAGHFENFTHLEDAFRLLLKKITRFYQADINLYNKKEEKRDNHRLKSNFTKEAFETMVKKAQEYIIAGDIFQVVLSQRFEMEFKEDPFEIYRSLRTINPSPYMYFLHFDDFFIAGASPETLVQKEGEKLTLRPIAGTIKRGLSDAEDQHLKANLLSDAKEKAEHIMLVDLGRNDLGRISKVGTVEVTDFMVIEKYSHVMHIVSNVESRAKDHISIYDVFRATFPAGTLSGAPKVRAMEIIEELETTKRCLYGGSVVNLTFNNNIYSCIAIRSVVIKDKKAFIQAGGGIVAHSKPENEYLESCNKAGAVINALYETLKRN